MNNRIIIFGNNDFQREVYEAGKYYVNKAYLSDLFNNYIVDNFSNCNLTSKKIFNFLSVFLEKYKYSKCIIKLGLADISLYSNEEFKENLVFILELLKNNNIKTVLLNIDNCYDLRVLEFNKIINELRNKYKASDSLSEEFVVLDNNINKLNFNLAK